MNRKNPPYYSYLPSFSTFRELVTYITDRYADRIAYTYRLRGGDATPVHVTYDQVMRDIRAIGTRALEGGYHGKHIALIGKLTYGWISIYFSMLSIGAVLVPLDPEWTGEELCDTITKAECDVVFFSEEIREKLAPIADQKTLISLTGTGSGTLEEFRLAGEMLVHSGNDQFNRQTVDPEMLAELVYTSGTTGKGKGVMLSQKALLTTLAGAFALLKIDRKTVGVLPPHHTYGSTVSLLSAFANGSETYISSGLRYLMREMSEQKPQHLILVPLYVETFYRKIWATAEKNGKDELLRRMIRVSNKLRKVGIDLRKMLFGKTVLAAFGGELHEIVCGGAPLSQTIVDAFDDFGVTIINGYGITECSPLISANRLCYMGKNSVGVAIPEVDVRIEDPNEDGEGEICVKGPNVMMGYFKDEKATSEVMDADGYFHTGDIGKVENDLIYVTGRKKNLIILSNGKNVYPEEIENALLTVPGVSEIVVYEGISARGTDYNAVVAEIFPDANYLKENGIDDSFAYFSKYVNEYNRNAVPYKKVGLVRIRSEEFPKNTMRKIQRFRIDCSIS